MTIEAILEPIEEPTIASEPAKPQEEELGGEHLAVSIDLLDKVARLTLANGMTKLLSYTQVARLINKYLETQEIVTGLKLKLPPNVFALNLNSSSASLSMYFPTNIRPVNFHGQSLPRVLPNVIVTVSMSRNGEDFKVTDVQYFCTSLDFPEFPRDIVTSENRARKITVLPFSNIYDTGKMCFGQNQMVRDFKKGDLKGLLFYYDSIWLSPFNNDLGVKALRGGNYNVDTWFQLLANLAIKGEPFPYQHIGI